MGSCSFVPLVLSSACDEVVSHSSQAAEPSGATCVCMVILCQLVMVISLVSGAHSEPLAESS